MADMIDILINYQETVVGFGAVMQCYSGILCVMPLHILTKLTRNLSGINIHSHARGTFGQLNQNRIVNITVDKDNALFGFSYKLCNKDISVKYLAVEEYAFSCLCVFTQSVKNRINLLICFQLFHLQPVNSLKQ